MNINYETNGGRSDFGGVQSRRYGIEINTMRTETLSADDKRGLCEYGVMFLVSNLTFSYGYAFNK